MDGESLARAVLSKLIDKYEDSESFRKDEPSKRRIQVRITDSLIHGYGSGFLDPDIRRHLHAALLEFKNREIVELQWVRFEEGNILDKVYLKWGALDEAYQYLSRTPRKDELSSLIAELEEWLHSALFTAPDAETNGTSAGWQWLLTWVADVKGTITSRGRIPGRLVPEDEETRRLLLRALTGLVRQGGGSLPVRLFSKKYLGHSKSFERQVQSSLTHLLRHYWPLHHGHEFDVPDDDSVLLREYGIEVGHDDIAFCGPICFHYKDARGSDNDRGYEDYVGGDDADDGKYGGEQDSRNTEIDASVFPHGLAIDASDVRWIEITHLSVVRILTIENKANYRAYVRNEQRKDELVVYLGGFASPAQRDFLRLLRRFAMNNDHSELPLEHWGDLDYGGILILQHLRNTCWPDARPWRMEPELLTIHSRLVETIDAAYSTKLERLLESAEYSWAHPLIRRILQKGGTLEQESLLV